MTPLFPYGIVFDATLVQMNSLHYQRDRTVRITTLIQLQRSPDAKRPALPWTKPTIEIEKGAVVRLETREERIGNRY